MTAQALQEQIWLTVNEAAALLRLSRSFVYQLMAAGDLPSVTVGRVRRIPLSGLREWAERQAARGNGNA